MKIKNQTDALDTLENLKETVHSLIDSLQDDYESDVNDWTKTLRLEDRIYSCTDLLFCETVIHNLFLDRRFFNEEEKFQAQKELNYFYQNILIRSIQQDIEVCEIWKFKDYRCINFQKKMRETMEALLEFYSSKLNFMNITLANYKFVKQQ